MKINNSRNALEHVKKVGPFWKIAFEELSPIVGDSMINLTDSDNVVSDEEADSSESSEEI